MEEPELAELDELQTYVGRKTSKNWVWTAIIHLALSILAMEIKNRSGKTFDKLWQIIQIWDSRKYFIARYCIYSIYIPPQKHLVLPKTQ